MEGSGVVETEHTSLPEHRLPFPSAKGVPSSFGGHLTGTRGGVAAGCLGAWGSSNRDKPCHQGLPGRVLGAPLAAMGQSRHASILLSPSSSPLPKQSETRSAMAHVSLDAPGTQFPWRMHRLPSDPCTTPAGREAPQASEPEGSGLLPRPLLIRASPHWNE